MSCALEYRKDFADGKLYASRNVNDIRHTYSANGANRSSLDWNLTLRQGRRTLKSGTGEAPVHGQELLAASSMPDLRSAERSEARRREPLTREHPDGPYKQVNLREASHHLPDKQWRRYFTRPQPSFDIMKENCSLENEAYQSSHITPQDRRIDRLASAISHGTCRDETISFRRSEGCEGTHVGQWRHLIDDKSRGHKHKQQMVYETTLRCNKGDPNGSRIADNRSDGCLVEMLGKKKWSDSKYERQAVATLASPTQKWSDLVHTGGLEEVAGPARPQDGGDAKMHHLSRSRNILPDRDENDRIKRKTKQERKDVAIPEEHPGKPRRRAGGGGEES